MRDQDKADFIGYCLAWHKFVKSHHDDEEATLFTKIEDVLKDKTVFEETHKEHGGLPSALSDQSSLSSALTTLDSPPGPQNRSSPASPSSKST